MKELCDSVNCPIMLIKTKEVENQQAHSINGQKKLSYCALFPSVFLQGRNEQESPLQPVWPAVLVNRGQEHLQILNIANWWKNKTSIFLRSLLNTQGSCSPSASCTEAHKNISAGQKLVHSHTWANTKTAELIICCENRSKSKTYQGGQPKRLCSGLALLQLTVTKIENKNLCENVIFLLPSGWTSPKSSQHRIFPRVSVMLLPRAAFQRKKSNIRFKIDFDE